MFTVKGKLKGKTLLKQGLIAFFDCALERESEKSLGVHVHVPLQGGTCQKSG